jgi:hypothetical protein
MFDFLKRKKDPVRQTGTDRGILVFDHTSEVIRAETLLKKAGFPIKVMGPPPEIQTGCDLVIQYPLIEGLNVLRILETAGLEPLEAVPITGPLLQPVDLFQVKDYGPYLMVRAANMKITVDKDSQVIVNVSGGGCPDVPYLARELVGRPLHDVSSPKDIGHTLCGYALHLAYEEMLRQCSPL